MSAGVGTGGWMKCPLGSAFQGCVSLDELHSHSRPPEKDGGGDTPESLTPVMRKEAWVIRFLLLWAPQACCWGTIHFLKYPFFWSGWIYLPGKWKDLRGLNKTSVFKLLIYKTLSNFWGGESGKVKNLGSEVKSGLRFDWFDWNWLQLSYFGLCQSLCPLCPSAGAPVRDWAHGVVVSSRQSNSC